jgi:hypothetical protein
LSAVADDPYAGGSGKWIHVGWSKNGGLTSNAELGPMAMILEDLTHRLAVCEWMVLMPSILTDGNDRVRKAEFETPRTPTVPLGSNCVERIQLRFTSNGSTSTMP